MSQKNQIKSTSVKNEAMSTTVLQDGLDKLFKSGYSLIDLNHAEVQKLGLPLTTCTGNHYIKAHLFVTDSGTVTGLPAHRIGQTLVFTPCNDGNTEIYTRTGEISGENTEWGKWEKLATATELAQALEQFKPTGAEAVEWGVDSCINTFVEQGTYNITGERLNVADGLPIDNSNPGHTFSARLLVLDSSITGNGDARDKCVTQLLTLSNRTGGDGDVYIRTGSAVSKNALTGGTGWEPWGKLQQNIGVGQVTSLDCYIDNGMYSGVYTDGNTFFETFAMVVINNYAVAGATGRVRSVSQFKYALNVDGTFSYKTRTGQGNTGIAWGDWRSLAVTGMYDNISTPDELLATVESLVYENTRAKEVEESVKRTAVDISSLTCTADKENVTLTANSMDGEVLHSVEIPVATTEKAGAMSVADKKGIDNLKTISVTDGECCDFSIVDEKNNAILILSDGHIRTKNFDSRAGVKFIDRDIYALGDSTTQGAGSGETSVLGSKSWFDRLVAKIQFRSYRKLAANGTVTMKQEGLGALSSQIKNLPVVGNPIILVMIGTNDINRTHEKGNVNAALAMQYEDLSETVSFAEAFRYNLETIKRRLPNAEIIVMMPLSPQLEDESDAESYRDIERTICKALSIPVFEVRNECGISKYCNYGFAQVAEDEIENAVVFMADALHPNNAGYERIANYVATKLNKYIQ